MTELQHEFLDALLSLDGSTAHRLVHSRARTSSPLGAIEELVAPALDALGKQWEQGTAALSQVYMAGRICEGLIDAVLAGAEPDLHGAGPAQPRMAIAVISDRHMLGKRIVCSVLRAAGFTVRDYGHGSAESLAARAVEDGLDILLLSALMLPSALEVGRLTAALAATAPALRVVVGGAPFVFDPELWKEVGAHAVGRSASDAIAIVRRLSGEASCAS
jgi:methanogenic corrinoid protein MtbC1